MPDESPVKIKKGELVTLNIDTLAFGGRGVARIDGLTVFIDGAVPLDSVRARIVKKKKRHAEARLVDILKPSPFRIDPPCRQMCEGSHCSACTFRLS